MPLVLCPLPLPGQSEGCKGGHSENVNSVIAEASDWSPNCPDAAGSEVADNQPDEEGHEIPVGSAATEFQDQCFGEPTYHEGEPKVVHGVTYCQGVTCMMQREGTDSQPNCPQAPNDSCSNQHGNTAWVENLLRRLKPTCQLIEGFPTDPSLKPDAPRCRPFSVADMQVRPIGHRD